MSVKYYEKKSLVVTTDKDVVDAYDGVISLREAILYANNGTRAADGTPTITFDSSLGNDIHIELDPSLGNIELTSGLYDNETLKIQGLENVTIQNGSFENGVIFVGVGNHAAFHDIDFNANSATEGGAIYNNKGYVTLSGNEFNSNVASSGGAIMNRGDMTLSDTIFSGNQTFANSSAAGGAIYNNAGSMTLHGATFVNNSAKGEIAYGGAIYNTSNAFMTLEKTTFFSGNSAAWGGGAIHNKGSMTLNSGSFSGNSAQTYGGAIDNDGLGNITLNNGSFNGNSAQLGGAIFNYGNMSLSSGSFNGNSAQNGGAIWNHIRSMMILSSGSFSGNSANSNGGAIRNDGSMFLSSASFNENSAGANGGAINNSKTMTLDNAYFISNKAGSNGGAIYNYGEYMTLNGVTFSGNSAAWDGEGGAIYNNGGTITLNNTKFETVSDTIYNEASMTFTGTISLAANLYTTQTITATNADMVFDISSYAEGNSTAIISDISKINGANSWSITVDAAQTNGTYKLASNASAFTGSMSVKTEDSTLIDTLTIDGTTVTVNNTSYTLKHDNSNLVLTISNQIKPVVELDWTWSINADGKLEVATEEGYTLSYATEETPAAWTLYTTPLTPITGTYYFKAENDTSTAHNAIIGYVGQSATEGGAIYNSETMTLDNAYFIGNKAGNDGGAIYNTGSMTLTSATFSKNYATWEEHSGGGAIQNHGSMVLSSVTFEA